MFKGMSILQVLMWLIVVAGAVGILFIVCNTIGIAIPSFVIQIFWVCVVVALAILAIQFIGSLINRTPNS